MPENRTVIRTIDCSYTTLRFREGPVDVSSADQMSVQITPLSATAIGSVTGVVTLQGGSDPRTPQGLGVAQTLTGSTPFVRDIDIATDRFIDGVVTTAQSGVVLQVTIHLRNNNS